jgi:hypothetical protein
MSADSLIELTRNVSAPFCCIVEHVSRRKTLRMASGKEVSMTESDIHSCRWSSWADLVPDVALRHRRKVDATSSGNPG